jgi:hypothetical protein
MATYKLGKKGWNGMMGHYESTIYQKIAGKWRVIGSLCLRASVSHDMMWERKHPRRPYNVSPVNMVDVRRRVRKGLKNEHSERRSHH